MPLGECSAERFRNFPVFPGVRALDFPMAYSNIVSTILQVATPFMLMKTGLHGNAFVTLK